MTANTKPSKKRLSLKQKQSLTGWAFLSLAAILIAWMNFYPMVRAFILSLQSGQGARLSFTGLSNYQFLLKDRTFVRALSNNFTYLLIQVPIMLVMALILATLLNDRKLRMRGLFRTMIFLPCATSLVSYAIVFRSLFGLDGFINAVLMSLGLIITPINWLNDGTLAKMVIIIALLWRWTGYNMVFYLSGLQNIDPSIYEAARIDGASPVHTFTKITVPLLKPIILLTAILSTNGTLQLFDESINLTRGGPNNMTISLSHYIFKTAFEGVPKFGYAAAMSYVIFIIVAVLAFIQMKVGDKRD